MCEGKPVNMLLPTDQGTTRFWCKQIGVPPLLLAQACRGTKDEHAS